MTPTIGSVFRYRNFAPLHELLCNVCIPGIFSDGKNSKDFMWKYSYISLTDWHQDINWKNYVNKLVISEEVNKWILRSYFLFEYLHLDFWCLDSIKSLSLWASRFFLLCKAVVLPFDIAADLPWALTILFSAPANNLTSSFFISSLSN